MPHRRTPYFSQIEEGVSFSGCESGATPSDLLVLKLAGGLQQFEKGGEGLAAVRWEVRCNSSCHDLAQAQVSERLSKSTAAIARA